jgi:hypothetical protein
MHYELAHRPRGATDATRVDIDALSSAAAIATLRREIPEEHVVLYVREVRPDTPTY